MLFLWEHVCVCTTSVSPVRQQIRVDLVSYWSRLQCRQVQDRRICISLDYESHTESPARGRRVRKGRYHALIEIVCHLTSSVTANALRQGQPIYSHKM